MKRLVVECVRIPRWHKAFLKIVEQTGILEEFCSNNYHEFEASNGWTIRSRCFPDILSDKKMFFVWGDDGKENGTIVVCSLDDADKIRGAVQEYNTTYSGSTEPQISEFEIFQ